MSKFVNPREMEDAGKNAGVIYETPTPDGIRALHVLVSFLISKYCVSLQYLMGTLNYSLLILGLEQ
jgi:hypothetical protein